MTNEVETAGDTKAAKLSTATELALDRLIEILSVPIEMADPQVDVRLVRDTALQVVSQQIRVDEARLRRAEGEQLVEYTAAVERQEKLLEPERKREKKAPNGTKALD